MSVEAPEVYTEEQPEGTGPQIEQQADMPPAGPAAFITLRDITFANDATNIYIRCTTDQATRLTFRMWRTNNPLVVYSETETPTAILGMRYQTLARSNLGAMDFSGETVMIEILTTVPPNPVGSAYLRPYSGSLRITGARSVAKGNAVPVRWNQFGDGTRPPNGGGNPARNMEGSGNWSSYTWAQYNPKMTTYPAP